MKPIKITNLIRPSSLKYWLACPMFKYHETNDVMKAADQGTENHALLQSYLQTKKRGIKLRDYIEKLTASDRPAIIEYALEQVRAFLQGYDVDKKIVVNCELKTKPYGGVKGGSADFVARVGDEAIIILDWKFVFAEPEDENAYEAQLFAYATSVDRMFTARYGHRMTGTRYTIAAVCPNLRKTYVYADRCEDNPSLFFAAKIQPQIRANIEALQKDPFTCRWNKFCSKCERAANRTCGIALAHALDPALAPDATDGRAILDKAKMLKAMAEDMRAQVLEREQAAPGTTGAKLRSRTIPPKVMPKRYLSEDECFFAVDNGATVNNVIGCIENCTEEQLALLIERGLVSPRTTSQYVQ